MKSLISIAEFCETFGVSRSTVYRLAQRGEIPFVHVGRAVRIRAQDADSWCDRLSSAQGKAFASQQAKV